MSKTPDVGATAPDFTLPGMVITGGEAQQSEYTLSAQRGKPLVLAFYPADDSSVCTKQMCAYSDGLENLAGLGAQVWGISPQGVAAHEQFARKHQLAMPLLADTEQAVTRLYGIALGKALRRSVFVLDADGKVAWKHVTLVGLTFPAVDKIAAPLAALAGR